MLRIAVIMQPFTFSLWSRVVIYFSYSLVYLIPNTIKKIEMVNMSNITSRIILRTTALFVLFLHFNTLVNGSFEFMWQK